MPRLTVLKGRKAIGVFDLTQERTLVGRGREVDVLLESPTVSREHCELIRVGDSFLVNSLSGKNGLFVNGTWVETLDLSDGDQIEIDMYTLKFEATEGTADLAEVPTPPPLALPKRTDATVPLALDDLAEVRAKMKAIKGVHLQQRDGDEILYHKLDRPKTGIGRAQDCPIRLGGWIGPKVSAWVYKDPSGRVSVEAAGGKVKVNGEQIPKETPLVNGDIVEVAGTKFKFASKI